MFGFSIGKLLLLAAIAAAVWFLWRRIGRRPPGPAASVRRSAASSAPEAMQKCPRCGVYMAPSAGRCEREDCPRPA
jgi:hypothetical protein